jgi:hypothetical protein
VKNEVTISDGLTQGTKVVGHALHLVTVVIDAEVTLLEDIKLRVELQNARLATAEELSLDREQRLMCGLRQFLNDLVIPGLYAKMSTYCMHDPGSMVPHIRPKSVHR